MCLPLLWRDSPRFFVSQLQHTDVPADLSAARDDVMGAAASAGVVISLL